MDTLGRFIIILLITWLTLVQDTYGIRNASEVIRRLSHFANKMERPNEWEGPTVVNVSLFITNFHALDETKMEMSMDLLYSRMWKDPRLAYKDGPNTVLVNADGAVKWFWIPDLYFTNAREVETHGVLKHNLGAWIDHDGSVKLSAKLTTTLHCPMNLLNFPLDVQKCKLEIESYMHTSESLDLRWNNPKAVSMVHDSYAPAFKLLNIEPTKQNAAYSSGTFHKLIMTIELRRLSSHYLLTTFLPSACIVLLSCLVYWLPLVALAERTFFSVFLFVAMTIVMATSQIGAPQVGYMKAIDVWVVSCIMFLFFNVLEVIILYLLARNTNYRTTTDQFQLMKDVDPAKAAAMAESSLGASFFSERHVKRVDWVLRIIYPCAFVLFNIIFWSTYAN